MIDYASDAIISVDMSGKIMFWNKTAEKIFGYTAEEILGKSIANIMPSYSEKKNRIQMKNSIVTKETVFGSSFESSGVRKDGSVFPLEFSYSMWSTQGRFFLTLIVRDISERKNMERSLRESEEKYRGLFENARDIIVILDLNGKIVELNKACEKYGVKKEEMIGQSVLSLFPKRYLQKVATDIKQSRKGKSINGEVEIAYPKGVAFIEYNGTPIKVDDEIVGIQIIARDITQRRKDEEKIRQSEKMFRELFETSLNGIVMIDMKGNVIDCNQAYADMLGYSREELKGKNMKQLTPKKWHTIEEEIIKKQVIKRGYSCEYEKELIRKDKTVFPITTRFWLIKDENGKPKGMWATIRDITEQKTIEAKREKYTKSLEAKLLQSERLAAIGELAGMVGHDLRNPLMGIAGAIYYLKTKSETKLNDIERKMLEIIEENVTYSNKIISDLQDYSRELTLELKQINMKTLLNTALSVINIPKNIQVINRTRIEHKVEVDENKMKRAFLNIIKNAIDAMPKGGKLTITSKKKNTYVEIRFTDTGKGMSKKILRKIGKPLFTTKAKGMGFGLAICKRIVEAHNGKLSVESAINRGTTVKIIIPIKQKPKRPEVWVDTPKTITSSIKA